jgi:iron complex transport system ATP-binding protein
MQLVMIARALAQNTPIVLLDEPTAHLDLNNRVEIMKLLRMLTRNTNKAILTATHELDLALQTADLIWLAGNDKKIRTGIPEDLVLTGVFDEVFRFKGFDLRTGKVTHAVTRDQVLKVEGEGHELLWTKNALERCGFKVAQEGAVVSVGHDHNKLHWSFGNKTAGSIKELIDLLLTQ